VEVNVYDFIDKTNGKASPYGVYDAAQNKDRISVGISSDTAAFSIAIIRSWWKMMAKIYTQMQINCILWQMAEAVTVSEIVSEKVNYNNWTMT
jgi:hypothetical protein